MEQMDFFQDLWCGKTCREPLVQKEQEIVLNQEKLSESSLKKQRGLLTQQYGFLDLRKGGQTLGQFWVMDLAYHGARSMLNTGEYPNAAVVSTLSQILEDNPHRKYYLSNKAVIGILRRASARGKELPIRLKSALIQQAREDSYGEKEITNAGEILRSLWEEVNQEDFENWIRRAVVLVQSEEVLLSVLLQQSEATTDNSKNRKAASKKDYSEIALSAMWKDWSDSCTPQGRKPSEQLTGELNKILLQLSRQTSPQQKLLYCMWKANERTWSLFKALSGVQEMSKEQQGTSGEAERCVGSTIAYGLVSKGNGEAFLMEEKHMALSCGGGQAGQGYPAIVKGSIGEAITFVKSTRAKEKDGEEKWVESDIAPTQNAFDMGDVRATTICIQGSMIGRKDENGPQGDGINEDVSFTLNATDRHAVAEPIAFQGKAGAEASLQLGINLSPCLCHSKEAMVCEAVVYGICSDKSNSMLSDNPFSGIYEADTPLVYENHPADSRVTGPHTVCPSATSRWGTGGGNVPFVQEPACNQGGMLICEQAIYDITHGSMAQESIGVTPTLTSRMGTGGNQVPILESPAYTMLIREGKEGGGEGPLIQTDKASTLMAGGQQTLFEPISLETYHCENHEGTASVLKARDWKDPQCVLSPTIIDRAAFNQGENALYDPLIEQSEVMPTCVARGPHAVQSANQSTVRRLTPLECERLQGYPDGWTDIPGASDSARYKTLGNSFAIPNALFVISGCIEAIERSEV